MEAEGLTVFFRCSEGVKKVDISPDETMETLREKFVVSFPSLGPAKSLPDLYVEEKSCRVKYAFADVKELYRYCVIEAGMGGEEDVSKGKGKRQVFAEFFMGRKHEEFVFVMVGMPARGKTYIARKIARYLNWLGLEAQVFNVGNYRRKMLGAHQEPVFFDPENLEGKMKRRYMAVLALDDMFEWIHAGHGRVGIYDATNSTQERRALVTDRCRAEGAHVVFIESICDNASIEEANIRENKLSSPDFTDMPDEEALRQFRKRIEYYRKAYVPIQDEERVAYVKLYEVGRKVEINQLPPGYMVRKVVFFLTNLRVTPRPIWLTRHGQSEFNRQDRIGGDSGLTEEGETYAQRLSRWLSKCAERQPIVEVWTSTLERSKATARYISRPKTHLRALDEIDAGRYDSLTYEEIAAQYPQEFAARAQDKLTYRYPGGESYADVIQRLEPVIFELERAEHPVLVVAHNAVVRCLYAYFMNKPLHQCPHIDIPLHTVFQLTPRAYGSEEQRFRLVE